jgi:uncharacterized protein (DUF488 family)
MRLPPLLPPATLWTVGHSTRAIEEFLDLLRAQAITAVADVRRFAGSRRNPQFQPASLQRSVGACGIGYVPMPELGGRRSPRADSPHVAWRNPSFRGYADYMDTAEFGVAAARLAALARTERVAVMCAEGVWWRCHRSMIADCFKAHGWKVLHILGPAEPREHPYTSVARMERGEPA